MKAEIKAKWVAALRGGEFKQAQGTLRDEDYCDHMCCLGVLCELHRRENHLPQSNWFMDSYLDQTETPPPPVLDWAGLEVPNPEIDEKRLSQWNDETAIGFEGIADLIEKHL